MNEKIKWQPRAHATPPLNEAVASDVASWFFKDADGADFERAVTHLTRHLDGLTTRGEVLTRLRALGGKVTARELDREIRDASAYFKSQAVIRARYGGPR